MYWDRTFVREKASFWKVLSGKRLVFFVKIKEFMHLFSFHFSSMASSVENLRVLSGLGQYKKGSCRSCGFAGRWIRPVGGFCDQDQTNIQGGISLRRTTRTSAILITKSSEIVFQTSITCSQSIAVEKSFRTSSKAVAEIDQGSKVRVDYISSRFAVIQWCLQYLKRPET